MELRMSSFLIKCMTVKLLVMVGLQILFAAIVPILSVTNWHDDCHTLSTQVDIVQNDINHVIEGQRVSITCHANVTVNKCEGICESIVSPSVRHPPFKKECRCCREGQRAERRITLQTCYNENGDIVHGLHPVVTIQELRNCNCFKCST